jgi:hypothetical protein
MGIDVEDIMVDDDKPKKIKSGRKGKRVENELCKRLNERFMDVFRDHPDWGRFSRTMGSGNRWGQKVILSKAAKETLSADITCPTNFKWVIESKGGYNDIDVFNCISKKDAGIDGFLKQVEDDAGRTGKKPLLVWKKDRKNRTAWIKTKDLPKRSRDKFEYKLTYRDWTAISFEDFLGFADGFFFDLDG